MKLFSIVLTALLLFSLVGCSTAGNSPETAASPLNTQPQGNTRGQQLPSASATVPASGTQPLLTRDEAQEIALKHAGFSADQVSRLRVEYDFDDGIPEYEVEFRAGGWEYDYTIHAQTGQILKSEKDWDD